MRILVIAIVLLGLLGCSNDEKERPEGSSDVEKTNSAVVDSSLSQKDPELEVVFEQQIKVNPDTSLRWSFRGLSVVSPNHIWLSGTNGLVMRSEDGGENWEYHFIEDCKTCDFRDIHAFNDSVAIAVNIASPGKIYKTIDGGQSWKKVFEDEREVFMDAIEFWNDSIGLVYGDPIDENQYILRSEDGGDTWQRLDHVLTPKALGTAGFAASGTSIALAANSKAWIGLGGDHSFVLKSEDWGVQWSVIETPMPQGNPGKGIYSLAFMDDENGVAVGGNWEHTLSDSCAAVTHDGGQSWTLIEGDHPNGYRSCVAIGGENCEALPPFYMTCGTEGVDLSMDKGDTWKSVSDLNLNVIEFAPETSVGWAVSSHGEIYRVEVRYREP